MVACIPQTDSRRLVPGRNDVARFRSASHNTLIGDNGAIAIQDLNGRVNFTKPGVDGRDI